MAKLADLGNDLFTGRRSLKVSARRRTWFTVAGALLVLSVLVLLVRGLSLGIEFEGGSQFTVSGTSQASEQPAHDVLAEAGAEQAARVSVVGDAAVRVQTEQLTTEETTAVRQGLAEAYGVPESEVTSSFIGPTWGEDITRQALTGLAAFVLLVAVVLALYFRTWTMAAAALAGLLNVMVVTVGLYAATGFEVTPATVIGFLTILGYSLYDTVVVFDKVRENTQDLAEERDRTYGELADLAVGQTLVRSINTSTTSLLPVASILFVGAFLLGGGTLRDIALALFIGMIASPLSSIFVATPLLVTLRERDADVAAHDAAVRVRRAARAGEGEPVHAPLVAARVVAGHHQGAAAQPRRRKKGHR